MICLDLFWFGVLFILYHDFFGIWSLFVSDKRCRWWLSIVEDGLGLKGDGVKVGPNCGVASYRFFFSVLGGGWRWPMTGGGSSLECELGCWGGIMSGSASGR